LKTLNLFTKKKKKLINKKKNQINKQKIIIIAPFSSFKFLKIFSQKKKKKKKLSKKIFLNFLQSKIKSPPLKNFTKKKKKNFSKILKIKKKNS
jgi:hypothetical protein